MCAPARIACLPDIGGTAVPAFLSGALAIPLLYRREITANCVIRLSNRVFPRRFGEVPRLFDVVDDRAQAVAASATRSRRPGLSGRADSPERAADASAAVLVALAVTAEPAAVQAGNILDAARRYAEGVRLAQGGQPSGCAATSAAGAMSGRTRQGVVG